VTVAQKAQLGQKKRSWDQSKIMPGKEWRPARRLQSIIGDGYGKIDSDSWNSSVLPLAVDVREMDGR